MADKEEIETEEEETEEDKNKEVLEKIQSENKKSEELLEKLKTAKAEAVVSGIADAGSAAPEKKSSEEMIKDRANEKLEGTGLTI